LDIQELFERVRVSNSRMVQIKEKLIQLLQELVKEKSLRPEIQIISKSGKKKYVQIQNLTSSSITRRIQYLKFNEIIHNHKWRYLELFCHKKIKLYSFRCQK
jgi:hypothetical protein